LFVDSCRVAYFNRIKQIKALGGLKKGMPVSACMRAGRRLALVVLVQDLLIFDRSADDNFCGLAVEFKLPGFAPRHEQVECMRQFEDRGWDSCVVHSLHDFKAKVGQYKGARW
jgi:hypothetical protein